MRRSPAREALTAFALATCAALVVVVTGAVLGWSHGAFGLGIPLAGSLAVLAYELIALLPDARGEQSRCHR